MATVVECELVIYSRKRLSLPELNVIAANILRPERATACAQNWSVEMINRGGLQQRKYTLREPDDTLPPLPINDGS